MIIKKGTKYYKVEREMSKDEVDSYKASLQQHYDTIDERIAQQVKELQDKAKENKDRTALELTELNAL